MEPRVFFPLIMLAFFAMVLFAVAVFMTFRYKQRELQHRERVLAIEKGAALPVVESYWRPTNLLLRGMMWVFGGFGLTLFLLALSLTNGREIPAAMRVRDAMQAKSIGAGEDQIREIMNDKTQPGLPLGFALIGLIPIGVGVAYLISYRSEKPLRTAS